MRLTLTVNSAQVEAALRKRSGEAVRKRADVLGQRCITEIEKLVRAEVGYSGSAGGRGMTALHDVPYTASTSGELPVTVTVRANVSGNTAGKFAAHNYGAGPHEIPGPIAFPGTNASAGRRMVVPAGRSATHPGTPGKQWLRRGMQIAITYLRAGFIR